MKKETLFKNALKDIFAGADIEGTSGYVNLLSIKKKYFDDVFPKLNQEIDSDTRIDADFKEEFYDKLYNFFHRYFSESGSIYFRHTPSYQKVYEQVYSEGKDVVLFWKTHMLYYVKSDVIFQSAPVEVKDEDYNTFNFFIDASSIENKKSNERKDLAFTYDKISNKDGKKIILINAQYSERGNKTKLEDIYKAIKKDGIANISEEVIEKAFRVFNKQSEVDFFINKDAKGFLKEQFDLWMYQYMFKEENNFSQLRIKQMQAIKDWAYKIIDFIGQFEDELVKVWNKPKFVRGTNYVITIDKISDILIKKIEKHAGLKNQIAEWNELGMIEASFDFKKRDEEKHKHLPLDTKYFKDLELEIIGEQGNLDESLDGLLIHSENYQALNTIKEKYRGQVNCIYIDPPYNTNSSPIIYVNNYKDSSWNTLIQNRLDLSKGFLTEDGLNVIAIDDVELRYLTTIADSVFDKDNYISTIATECNPQGRVSNKVSQTSEYHIIHSNDITKIDKIFVKKYKDSKPVPLKRTGTNSRREQRPNRYYPILEKNGSLKMISLEEFNKIYDNKFKKFNDSFVDEIIIKYEKLGFNVVLPMSDNGEKLVWQRVYDRVSKELNTYTIRDNTIYTPGFEEEIPKTLWKDPLFSNPEYGSEYLKHVLGHSNFETPKSFHTVKQFISMTTESNYVLDYFGGSGTTAQAVMELNKLGNTYKYIVVEMGEHFYSVILPRLKKLSYSSKWKDGKSQEEKGVSHFFKYYSLEQYEETLARAKYSKDNNLTIWDGNKSPFAQYVFNSDQKLTDFIKVSDKNININLTDIYPDIDIAETLSNITGKHIAKKNVDTVEFMDGTVEKINTEKMTLEEKMHFISLIKPLIWWGE